VNVVTDDKMRTASIRQQNANWIDQPCTPCA